MCPIYIYIPNLVVNEPKTPKENLKRHPIDNIAGGNEGVGVTEEDATDRVIWKDRICGDSSDVSSQKKKSNNF